MLYPEEDMTLAVGSQMQPQMKMNIIDSSKCTGPVLRTADQIIKKLCDYKRDAHRGKVIATGVICIFASQIIWVTIEL